MIPLIWLLAPVQAAPEIALAPEHEATELGAVEPEGGASSQVSFAGYAETEYHDDLEQSSFFDAHRVVLFAFARPHDRISFATEIEWEHGGTPRKRNGSLDVGEVLLEYAVADFTATQWLQARAGIVLVPMGAYNLRHDAPTQDLTVRPLVSTLILPSTWFEVGAGLFGHVELGSQRIDYEAYAINGLDTKLYDGLGARAARGSLGEDNNRNKAVVGRVSVRPVAGLETGLSGYVGAYDPGSTRFVRIGALDLAARWRGLELQGEVARTGIDAGFDEGWPDATRDPVPTGMWGMYLQANVHLRPAPLTRALPDDLSELHFTAVVRLEEVDTDLGQLTDGDRFRAIAGLNVRPIEAFVWKNELIGDTNGAGGSVPHPWHSAYRPSASFVSSIAIAF